MKPRKISHIVVMGDSLSDRGSMDHRRLFGIIPMDKLSGLTGQSPDGRFSNGYTWTDYIGAMIANEFLVKDIETGRGTDVRKRRDSADDADDILDHSPSSHQKNRKRLDPSDIADGIIDGDLEIVPLIDRDYNLDKYKEIDYNGENLIRSGYAEGGLTAHDYSWAPSKSISRFFSRLILSTLGEMRKRLFADDDAHEISRKHKEETLVVEWSGANDLITVNAEPSMSEADKAVKARIDNIKQLIKAGYRNFNLFNLPDLALVPRFQALTQADRDNATKCCNHFNQELDKACKELSLSYPHCSIEVFNVNKIFTDVYNKPEPIFEQAKLKIPYVNSPDFRINADGTSPAKGYMFWNDVHPSADMHALLAEHFLADFRLKYNITEPKVESVSHQKLHISEDQLLVSFRKVYADTLRREQHGFFGSFRRSNIAYQKASLDEILTHALYQGGHRSLAVMKELKWFDGKGDVYLNIKALEDAVARVREAQSPSTAPSQPA